MIKRYILIPFIVFALLLAIMLKSYNIFLNSQGNILENTLVKIPPGSSDLQIGKILEDHKIINNKLIFCTINLIKGNAGKLKAGEYLFLQGDKLFSIINRIYSGKVYFRKITILEGAEVNQIIKIINNTIGLTGSIKSEPLEGSLLPETYYYNYYDSKESIINRMTRAMNIQKEKAWINRDKNLILNDSNELIILASIIEEETALNREKKIISGVFFNRLKKNMLLQSDPTVIYGLFKKNNRESRKLNRADLKINTSWNTYMHKGLPLTPISNPGVESILAAANPEKNDFFYFVANGKGGHNFSKTLKQHNKNVKIWKNIINCKKKVKC